MLFYTHYEIVGPKLTKLFREAIMLEIIQTPAYRLLVYLQLYRENFSSVSVLESSVACICTRLWLEHVSLVDKNLDCRL